MSIFVVHEYTNPDIFFPQYLHFGSSYVFRNLILILSFNYVDSVVFSSGLLGGHSGLSEGPVLGL